MLLLIEANHRQSIERRIFISRPVGTTDLDKYANKMFNKLRLSFLLAVIAEKMFASYVFSDKNQTPLRISRMQITKQGVAILSLILVMKIAWNNDILLQTQ